MYGENSHITKMISFILLWIGAITTFLLGYFLGKGKISTDTFADIKKQIEHKTYPQYTQPSGIIKRPDAKRVRELNDPKVQEESEAMRDLLGKGLDGIKILTK